MSFKQKGKEPLDARINLRLPTREKIIISDDADLAGIAMSEVVRARYFGRPIVANVDLLVIRELRRLGGLLKSVHVESKGAYSKDTAAAISQLSEYISKLSKSK